MSRNINIAPSYCKNAKATKRGWEDPKTGELLVSNRSLDLELIESAVSVKEPTSTNVETTLYDETSVEPVKQPKGKMNLSILSKSKIIEYAKNVFNLTLSMEDTKKTLIEQIKNKK